MTMLQPIAAVAFQGARKRYFTRKAAEASYFWAALKRHCECEDPDYSNQYGGMTCRYHEGDHRDRIAKLKSRFLRIHFRRPS